MAVINTYEIKSLHCSVHFVHDVVWLALRTDSEVPFGSFDRRFVHSCALTSTGRPLSKSSCIENYLIILF